MTTGHRGPLENWASRTGSSADEKRATIEVTVPTDLRPSS